MAAWRCWRASVGSMWPVAFTSSATTWLNGYEYVFFVVVSFMLLDDFVSSVGLARFALDACILVELN